MNRKAAEGFTLVEVLIGITIFLVVVIPLTRFVVTFTSATTVKDQRNAYAILRGECSIMYKNQKLPQKKQFITVDNRVYEFSCVADGQNQLMDWTMSVKKAGKLIASLQGLLYVPYVSEKNVP